MTAIVPSRQPLCPQGRAGAASGGDARGPARLPNDVIVKLLSVFQQ
jgi:hypothetical protein